MPSKDSKNREQMRVDAIFQAAKKAKREAMEDVSTGPRLERQPGFEPLRSGQATPGADDTLNGVIPPGSIDGP